MRPMILRLFSWFLDCRSARTGMLYLASCALFLVGGIAAAIVMQLDMMTPASQLTGAAWYGRILTGHGMLTVFLVLLPLFPGVFGQIVLPSALGLRNLALRKVSRVGWLCHAVGGVLLASALVLGAYDGGWEMMMPVAGFSALYLLMLGGLALAALAVLLPSLAIVRTTLSHKYRHGGLAQLPLFAWFLLFGACVHILVTPVRLITLGLMGGGQIWGWTQVLMTDPTGIVRYQQLFWLYVGPAVLSLMLPAIGIVFEVLAARTGTIIRARTAIVSAGLWLGVLGIASWSQHLIGAADQELLVSVGSLFGLMMTAPAMVIVLYWLKYFARIHPPYSATDLFVLLATVSGALTGIASTILTVPALALFLHGTYFTVAHLHIAVVGSLGGALCAGLFHFWSQWFRTTYSDRLAKTSAVGMLAGVGMAFLPMIGLGSQGSPRSLHIYPEQFQTLHVISSIGSLLLVVSLLLAIAVLIWSAARRTAPSCPAASTAAGEFSYTDMSISGAGESRR